MKTQPAHPKTNCHTRHLGQAELASRWGLSTRTLEHWRYTGIGPVYLKLGNKVAYRLQDIESYEAKHAPTSPAEKYQTSE